MKQKDDISVVDSILDEKGSDVHNVCDDDNYDDDKDDWGNVLRNCQIFTTFYEPLSANCVTLWICFRVPDVPLYSTTNLGGFGLKLMHK